VTEQRHYEWQQLKNANFIGLIALAVLALAPIYMGMAGLILVGVITAIFAVLGGAYRWRENRRIRNQEVRSSDNWAALGMLPFTGLGAILSTAIGLFPGTALAWGQWVLFSRDFYAEIGWSIYSGFFATRLGNPGISEEKMREVARACHIAGFIERLPDGYDTVIAENGEGFSQGQKQLLCIARVMMSNPSMLILDEATSSIDTRTELKIQEAFNRLMEGRTSFIVAHRLSTIRNADVILVMKAGHIIEQGNHEELMAKQGFYYTLYESQFLGKAI